MKRTSLRLLDHRATDARAGGAGRLGGQIVWVGVKDQAATEDVGHAAVTEGRAHLDHRDGYVAGIVRFDIAEITDVGLGVARRAVVLGVGIEMPARRLAIGGAAVAGLVDVEAVLDADYYLRRYPDVERSGADPLEHYSQIGWREGRDPSPHFSTSKYLEEYEDVRLLGLNPLEHWVRFGRREGRKRFSVASSD